MLLYAVIPGRCIHRKKQRRFGTLVERVELTGERLAAVVSGIAVVWLCMLDILRQSVFVCMVLLVHAYVCTTLRMYRVCVYRVYVYAR